MVLLAVSAASGAQPASGGLPSGRTIEAFNSDWLFWKGDATGAEQPGYKDDGWRRLTLPHDFSIEGPFDEAAPSKGDGAFLPGGIGWYRKSIHLSEADRGSRISIEFDGVMANSDVWINGVHLGKRPFGYVSFRYDLTPHVNFSAAAANVIAVRADTAEQPASRWYAGSGIYRKVRLVKMPAIHFAPDETFITTTDAGTDRARVKVSTSVINTSDIEARSTRVTIAIRNQNGDVVASAECPTQSLASGASQAFEVELPIAQPKRWDVESPYLYRADVRIEGAGQGSGDAQEISFGIRESHFEAATGYWLNGRNVRIYGVCLHEDGGGFGMAVPLAVWERRLDKLREIGVNAIRPAHHPFSPEFLDLCDRRGFLVMNEMFDAWTIAKRTFDYSRAFSEWALIDTRDTVKRDRNHPSIFIWSVGNEIPDTNAGPEGRKTMESLRDTIHQYDPSRPVTQALFRPNVGKVYDNGYADALDVVGQNYRENEIIAAHAQKPTRKIIATEVGHERRTWLTARDNPPYSGQFVWTGWDYLGEAQKWPSIATPFGLFDRTGVLYPKGAERASWWSSKPVLEIVRRVAPDAVTPTDPGWEPDLRHRQVLYPDWTPANLDPHDETIEVYSNAPEVELMLNEQTLGSKSRPDDDSPRQWTVPFAAGVLRAIGRRDGQVLATTELKTARQPARVALSAERPSVRHQWDDVVYVHATVVDESGTRIPRAADKIAFEISGPGEIAIVDNADNSSHEPFQAKERSAYQGHCIAVIKATAGAGDIRLKATAQGLQSSEITIRAEH